MPTTKSAPRKVARRKNPAVVAAGEPMPLPFLQPSYPVKPWVDAVSGLSYHTVSVELDSGKFLCIIAEFPQVRVTAATQFDAERAALKLYQRRKRNPSDSDTEAEDEDDMRVAKLRAKQPLISLEKVLAEYGR